MKKGTKLLFGLLSVTLCAVLIFSTAPVSKAAGMMRFIIDDQVYNKVYNDMGSVVLTHYHYDYSEDKLTLENFGSADSPETPLFIYPYSGNITIELKGNNYIKSEREMALIVIGNVTFTGDGTLNVISADTYGIYTDYKVTVAESASLNVNALAGVTAIKGLDIRTAGNINIHTTGKCFYVYEDIKITQGKLNLSGSNGLYTAYGEVYIGGGDTELTIDSTSRAIYAPGENSYIEFSANAIIYAGDSAPGYATPEYTGEKYLRMSFDGAPKLNPPRTFSWDDTVIDSAGVTNPVGRWSAVENATGYEVYLYHYNEMGYTLTKTFTVTDALSCNFGGHFTTYGKYAFAVRALGDGVDYKSSNVSGKTPEFYYFTGEVESRFYVTLPESEYFTVVPENGSTVVYYGESFSFTVDVNPAYTQSDVIVWANGVRVALRHGKYTVDNVTENLVIKIGDMAVNTYTVNLPEHEAYTIYPLPEYSTEVEYGDSFAFSIELSDIYLDSNPVVTSNGEEIIPKYGIIYTIKNITEDQTVEITGLVRDNYKVTYQHLDGTFITSQTVDHGDSTQPPEAPTLAEGLEFAGWSLKDGTAYSFDTPVESELTLYARFEPQKENGYYLISTVEQFTWFKDEVNFGNTAINARLCIDIAFNEGKYYKDKTGAPVFTQDAQAWKPIGGYDYSDSENLVNFYEGKFDGGGHTLSGICIDYDKMSYESKELGVFGGIAGTAVISNLNVVDSSYEAYGNMGGIVGTSYGKIENCTSAVYIKGVEVVGGIVGENHGTVTGCTFNGLVKAAEYSSGGSDAAVGGSEAGGIAGVCAQENAVVENCTNNGSVTAKKNCGGIVGAATSDGVVIRNCLNTSAVYADTNSAGILGYNPRQTNQQIIDDDGEVIDTVTVIVTTTVTDCSNSGSVSSLETSGGIVAYARAVVNNCTNSGEITSTVGAGGITANALATVDGCVNNGKVNGALYAGGVAALGEVTVNGSVNRAEVISSNGAAAGLAAGGKAEIAYSYNTGAVTGSTFAGGLAANTDNSKLVSSHNFALVTAQQADGVAANSTGLTVERCYTASELSASAVGISATKELFYCGYVAVFLNGEDEKPVWAQGEEYPVLADENNKAYLFPLAGEGTAEKPYIITTENELRMISAYINNHSGWSAKHYKLGADIALKNPQTVNNFVPFGDVSNQFAGSFDGDGHTLSGVNLFVQEDNVALFRAAAAGAQIKNLTLSDFTVVGKVHTGALIGTNRGSVYNCCVTESDITGEENVGGLVGYNLGDITYSVNRAEVNGLMCLGGIAGLHERGDLHYCLNYGKVVGTEGAFSAEAGGLAGRNYGSVRYCGNLGNIKVNEYAGGIVGVTYSELRSVYNTGNASADNYAGTIVGFFEELEDFELCYTLEGLEAGVTGVGTPVPEIDFSTGMLAYFLNNNGKETNWAQGDSHPVGAKPDGSDAVVYKVTYLSFGEVYYTAAAKKNSAAVTPPVPTAEGYRFLYWDTSFDSLTADVVTTAVFDRPSDITFMPYAELEYMETDIISVICGISPEDNLTTAQLRNQISNPNIVVMDKDMIEYSSPEEKVYTGQTVVLYGANEGIYIHIANIVVFGDISGDGNVDDTDAFLLNMVLSDMIWFDELYPAEQLAADVNRDGTVDRADAEYLQKYLLHDNEISQSAVTDNL